MPDDPLITKQDVLRYLTISQQTLYRLMKKRAFPFYKVGRRVLFRKADVDAWLEKYRVK